MAEWHKSSFSNPSGSCAEVRQAANGDMLMRHSKAGGPAALRFTPAEWDAFLAGVRAGEFDREDGPA